VLEGADRLPEGVPFLAVGQRVIEGLCRDGQRGYADRRLSKYDR